MPPSPSSSTPPSSSPSSSSQDSAAGPNDRALQLTRAAAEAASDKLATDIIAFDVGNQLVITDVFLLCSAANDRQVRAIVDGIEERLRALDARPVRREGEREGRWILLDYVDLIVHVQHAEERVYYALERLWRDCPLVELPEEVRRAAGQRGHGPAAAERDATAAAGAAGAAGRGADTRGGA